MLPRLVAGVQALPLRTAARVGRLGGEAAWWLDWVHRRVALDNLGRVWGGERSPAQLRALARENFRRIGENSACAVKPAALPDEARSEIHEVEGAEKLLTRRVDGGTTSVLVAIGHFGNFELYARFGQFVPAYQCATTYRGLRQSSLNRLLQSLREKSGCLFFERRTDAAALRAAMNQPGIMLRPAQF